MAFLLCLSIVNCSPWALHGLNKLAELLHKLERNVYEQSLGWLIKTH